MTLRFIDELKNAIQSSIPTDSAIIGKVANIIHDPASNANDLAVVIEQDPPLTAKILKTANSTYYGATSSVNSIRRAVVNLGFDTIKQIISTVSMSQFFYDADPKKGGLDRKGLWIHSVAVGTTAKIISTRFKVGRPDVGYTVGLLHDMGKIVLSAMYPDHYNKVVDYAKKENTRILLAEQYLMNTDHSMVGKLVSDIWSLPEDISDAIMYHHDPSVEEAKDPTLVRLIHLSDIFARTMKIGNPGDTVIPEINPDALPLLGSTDKKIKENTQVVLEELDRARADINTFFSEISKP